MNEFFKMLLCCQRVMVESSLICCISLIENKKQRGEKEGGSHPKDSVFLVMPDYKVTAYMPLLKKVLAT